MIRTKTRGAALLATVAIALAGCTGGSTQDPTTTAPTTSSPASDGGAGSTYPTEGSSDPGTATAECSADSADQEVPTEAPVTDAWPIVNGTGIPVSNTYGPINRDGEAWSCFAHSPKGALFAAAYIRPLTGVPAVRDQYVIGGSSSGESASSADGVDLKGFKFRGYDESTASIEVVYEASQNGQSGLVAFPVTLYWEDGRWVTHRADFEGSEPHSITGLTGYVQWSLGS